jgi:hypothetical protein
MKMKTLVLMLFALAVPSGAFASLEWDFAGGAADLNATMPGGLGVATAVVTVDPVLGEGWHNDWNLGTARGYWDLGTAGSIQLQIPVASSTGGPLTTKVTVVQWVDEPLFSGALGYSIPGAVEVGSPFLRTVEDTGFGKWVSCESLWMLPSVAKEEFINIGSPPTGALVDRISVENVMAVVPEPPGIVPGLLLGAGFALSLIWRRAGGKPSPEKLPACGFGHLRL